MAELTTYKDKWSVANEQASYFASSSTDVGSSALDAMLDTPVIEPKQSAFVMYGMTAALFALAITVNGRQAQVPDDYVARSSLLSESQPESYLASHFAQAFEEMRSYEDLKDGWDGVGSVAPGVLAIHNAKNFMENLPGHIKAPEATVSSDGSVGWYWKSPGKFISISFFPDGKFAYYGEVGDYPAVGDAFFYHGTIPQDLLEVIERA